MIATYIKLCLLFITFSVINANKIDDYMKIRNDFIKSEESKMLGSQIILNEKELNVNDILMAMKVDEIDDGFKNPLNYLPGQHFFQARKRIEETQIFKVLQQFPKGAMLHGHDTALASDEFVFNLTYTQNLYACTINGRLRLHFFEGPIKDETCAWESIDVLRNNDSNFDAWLKTQITLIVDNPTELYTDINTVWNAFMEIFTSVGPLIEYKPIFKEYFYQVLKELHEDNVMYLEIRTTLPQVYDFTNKVYTAIEVVQLFKDVVDEFKKDWPNFLGAKIIYSPMRLVAQADVDQFIKTALELTKMFPDFVAGFDLVGQEDLGVPLIDFIHLLIDNDLKYFFHAGETNWHGQSTDFNLIDAVLLNTSRIGHGFALSKHPKVLEMIKDKNIAIEVSPISNQVLLLVDDMRNHPAGAWIADGYPVVICYDDPSFWGVKGLSYDWYEAFMGIVSSRGDLKVLKQLALNSLMYSSMKGSELENALSNWYQRYEVFLDYMLNSYKKG